MTMTGFQSYKNQLNSLLPPILEDPKLHQRWLNTLSFLENSGSRKIAACEHPMEVTTEVLKHAAEEARHAFFLKQLYHKIGGTCATYASSELLGGHSTRRLLDRLDLTICRWIRKEFSLIGTQMRDLAYLLVTYAIECRAGELYPLYQEHLKSIGAPISMRSLILEEEQHLAEMEEMLLRYPEPESLKVAVCEIESRLFGEWIKNVEAFLPISS